MNITNEREREREREREHHAYNVNMQVRKAREGLREDDVRMLYTPIVSILYLETERPDHTKQRGPGV